MQAFFRLCVFRHVRYLARFLRVRLRMGGGQLDEHRFKGWMETHVEEVLRSVGVGSGQTVLDFGCGAGACALAAARLVGPGGRVYAVDMKEDLLKALSRRADFEGLSHLHTLLAEGSRGPAGIEPGTVDIALLYDVLQLVDQKEELLNCLRRALKPGGVLSVFPMHLGEEKLKELLARVGGFSLRCQQGLLYNYVADRPRGQAAP